MTASGISLISDNINTLVVEGSINTIGENAFKGIKVSHIELKEGIRKIENYAFYNCIGPKKIVIPKSVTRIGSGIFELSQGFNNVTILGDVSVGISTFGALYSPVDILEVAGKIDNMANIKEYQQYLRGYDYTGKIPVVIDFYATWCGPCKMLAPYMERLAKEYEGRIKVLKVDVDKNSALASAARIQSIPTLFFIDENGEIERYTGALPYSELVSRAEKLLVRK